VKLTDLPRSFSLSVLGCRLKLSLWYRIHHPPEAEAFESLTFL
jgi:hypothetical protein